MSQSNAHSDSAAEQVGSVDRDNGIARAPAEDGGANMLDEALERLERALTRIERAAVLKPVRGETGNVAADRARFEELQRKHGAMRSKVGGALEQLDTLLAELVETQPS